MDTSFSIPSNIPAADREQGFPPRKSEFRATEEDWQQAQQRMVLYLRALDVSSRKGLDLALEAMDRAQGLWRQGRGTHPVSDAMECLRALLTEKKMLSEDGGEMLNSRRAGGQHLRPMPPLNRGEMLPDRTGDGRPRRKGIATLAAWEKAARFRRMLLLTLIGVTTVVAGFHMGSVLPAGSSSALRLGIVAVFCALFAWISIGFWTAMAGLFTLVRRHHRFAILESGGKAGPELLSHVRTAVLIPICNEEVDPVFRRLQAMYYSLGQTGHLEKFDLFVLSDSSSPDRCVEEEVAWADLCRAVDGSGRIFYRHRRVNLKRKNGNIADFCRRWGNNYRYMVVLDADSVMTGQSIVRMVQLMEQHPRVGILQTAPVAVGHETLIARIKQFAVRLYGPLFAAGLHYTQLGDSHFWGHNAVIRVAPFMKHCGLPRLSGRFFRAGDILSHDFVEAAFMRRSGWEVWLAYDMSGSYEDVPPTLLEELKRDLRWCRGNMQHVGLLFTKGLFLAHRVLFLNGVMAYVSALLWFVFLALSTVEAVLEVYRIPLYFPAERTLFPQWPVWHPQWALTLLSTTAILLFLPKLAGLGVVLFRRGNSRLFGGAKGLFLSVAAEVLFSALLAPVRMVFHSKFVVMTALGREVGWGTQQRSDRGTGWIEALRFHWSGMLLGMIWGAVLFVLNRSFFWWVTPIVIPLVLSVPLSAWSSRMSLGRRAKELGLFLIPEEVKPPRELEVLKRDVMPLDARPIPWPPLKWKGFVRAVVDPRVNALHRGFLRKERSVSQAITRRRKAICDVLLHRGPTGVSGWRRREVLRDAGCVRRLHWEVWKSPCEEQARMWGIAS